MWIYNIPFGCLNLFLTDNSRLELMSCLALSGPSLLDHRRSSNLYSSPCALATARCLLSIIKITLSLWILTTVRWCSRSEMERQSGVEQTTRNSMGLMQEPVVPTHFLGSTYKQTYKTICGDEIHEWPRPFIWLMNEQTAFLYLRVRVD